MKMGYFARYQKNQISKSYLLDMLTSREICYFTIRVAKILYQNKQ